MRFALLAVVLIAGCDAFYSVRGKVTSCATNAPVSGAQVDLRYPGEHGRSPTDPSGTFTVSANDPPGENPATLTVAAPGFKRETRTVHNGDDVQVCLKEDSAPQR